MDECSRFIKVLEKETKLNGMKRYYTYITSFFTLVLFSLGYYACQDIPNPNVGLEIPDSIIVNTWNIEQFTVDTSDFSNDFSVYTISFLDSRQLEFRRNGVLVQFDVQFRTWNIAIGNALFVSVDIPVDPPIDPRNPNFPFIRELQLLSRIYVATLVEENRLELINRDTNAPVSLILTR